MTAVMDGVLEIVSDDEARSFPVLEDAGVQVRETIPTLGRMKQS